MCLSPKFVTRTCFDIHTLLRGRRLMLRIQTYHGELDLECHKYKSQSLLICNYCYSQWASSQTWVATKIWTWCNTVTNTILCLTDTNTLSATANYKLTSNLKRWNKTTQTIVTHMLVTDFGSQKVLQMSLTEAQTCYIRAKFECVLNSSHDLTHLFPLKLEQTAMLFQGLRVIDPEFPGRKSRCTSTF